MASRQAWAAPLIENSGAATGDWVIFPGGVIGITFEGTVTDVDIEILTNNGTAVIMPTFDAVATATYLTDSLPPCQIRAKVNTGTAVYVYAAKVI